MTHISVWQEYFHKRLWFHIPTKKSLFSLWKFSFLTESLPLPVSVSYWMVFASLKLAYLWYIFMTWYRPSGQTNYLDRWKECQNQVEKWKNGILSCWGRFGSHFTSAEFVITFEFAIWNLGSVITWGFCTLWWILMRNKSSISEVNPCCMVSPEVDLNEKVVLGKPWRQMEHVAASTLTWLSHCIFS